eukprot:scpid60093/ scgid1216/ 
MDPQAISDVAGGDAGTKKKSSFQITSVRKGDTASLSSDVVGAIDEFDVDADEGEADGDEEEDNLSGSVSLDQPNENGHLADTGLAAPDVPQSQSKYRVVRIKKNNTSVDRKFHRGRWDCWDFVNGNGGEQTHSPGDAQNQEEEQSRKNSRKPSDITVEEPPSDNAVNHDESKRNPSAPATGGESSTSTGSRPSGSGKKVAFGPVATATAVATTGAATAAEDTTPSQSNGNEPRAAADHLLAAVNDAVRKFSTTQQQEVQTLRVEVNSLSHSLDQSKSKEKSATSENSTLREANDSLVGETNRLTGLVQELIQDTASSADLL